MADGSWSTGMYVLPGFIDAHVHAGAAPKNPDAEYPYKLWLAHGVTTVRGVPLTDNALAVKEEERSARNEIVAPRIFNYQRPGSGWGKGVPQTPEHGAATLYEPMHKTPQIGMVREGMLADMVIVDQNPLQNFKVLYANGTIRLNDKTGKVERVGGIKWTIKDGIAYDAKKLSADVQAMVERQKRAPKKTTTAQ